MATDLSIKNPHKFNCTFCNYFTSSCKDFNKHEQTQKHKRNTLATFSNVSATQKSRYICKNCNKEYHDRTGLWRHNKICNHDSHTNNTCNNNDEDDEEDDNEEINISTKQLVLMLFKQNNELQQSLIEMSKQTSMINNNSNNMNHSNNKTFNLQLFLNETCKNAMNIKDFVDSVQLDLADLENVGKSGYIEGISNIIIKNLNALEVDKRPIHCTDNKREVIYVKDEDKWEKEEESKPKIRKLIKEIAHKNICMFKKFREKYPDCDNYDSKKSDAFNKIVYESMGGKGDDELVKENKIIHKISKQVTIDKDTM
jgi:hypothetical protein